MITRTIIKQILKKIETYPVTLVTGARQIGKTTACLEIKKQGTWKYVTLENNDFRLLANTDPKRFLEVYSPPVIIDEIQYAPILFEYINTLVNQTRIENKNANGMFLLTGSQQYGLMRNVTQSLAGRVGIIDMLPLSQSEIMDRDEIPFLVNKQILNSRCEPLNTKETILEKITRGSFPELHKSVNLETKSFYQDYLRTYLERDVRELTNLKDWKSFNIFLKLLAANCGGTLSYEILSRDVGVNQKTIRNWINILETTNLIYQLHPYYEYSFVKQLVKRPKIYFFDTGLLCYLNGLSDPLNLEQSILLGRILENYVINEIIKSYINNGADANFYYYRDKNQAEIDFIIQTGGKNTLIEIKTSSAFSSCQIKHFKVMDNSKYPLANSALICLVNSVYQINEKVYAVPISAI
ncbi:ATP-binding protein [[Mycoplasma] testudinis]|uniref:ATP-binding protein n=1 Tax=[Mycoplasma] testudinis TaxID=33924 RepID=UPI00056C4CE8|nr:ATP-binding protein [[Mycoplasma] testudinis]